MRIAPTLLLLAALPLAACQVTEDKDNGAVSMSYNEDLAANTASDVANTAGNVAAKVGNEAEKAADSIGNEVGRVDVDIDRKDDPKPATNTN